jgi:hypothetical protein
MAELGLDVGQSIAIAECDGQISGDVADELRSAI